MTTDTAHDCQLDWCQARACDCPYSNTQPHQRAGCRYARDDDQADDE